MRWIFRLFLILLSVVVVAIGGLFLLPKDRLAAIAADQITRATGRHVTLQGDLSPSFYPQLGVKTGAVEIAAADWASEGPLLTAEGLSIGVDLTALLSGEIKVREIDVLAPVITLERDQDGRESWVMETGDATNATEQTEAISTQRAFTLDQIVFSNGTFRMEDRQADVSLSVTDIELTARLPDYQGPLRYEVTAQMNGERLGSVGTLSRFGAFLAGDAVDVELSAGVGAAVVGYTGQMDLSGTLSGALQADLTDLDALFGVIGQSAPALPNGVGDDLRVEGLFDAAFPLMSLTDAQVTIGSNDATGDLVVDLTATPKVTGVLQAGALDLSAMMQDGPSARAPADTATAAGWSDAPIDASGLSALDATLTLSAASINLGTTRLGPSRIKAVLDASRLSVISDQITGFGGTLAGELVLNNRNGLSVRATISARDIILQDMLGDLADFQRLQGRGQAELTALGSGASVAAIMTTLSGDGQVRVGQGALTGIDLVSLVRRGQGTGDTATTIFDGLSASFALNDGVMVNEDLTITANLFEATGDGRIDLGQRAMDYQIIPRLFEGESDGIAIPIRLKGPWSDLSIYPDLEAVAAQELAREREKLQQKIEEEAARVAEEARQRAAEEASQALGVEVDEGQSLGDAVEQKLEDQLRKGLGGLLGGN
jgi:AsmA protein